MNRTRTGTRRILRLCRYGTVQLKEGLKELVWTTYINKVHLLFGSPSHKNSTVKRAWLGVVVGWVTFWEVFLESMQVRTTHAEKTRVGLWGQSTILEAVWDVTRWLKLLRIRSSGKEYLS